MEYIEKYLTDATQTHKINPTTAKIYGSDLREYSQYLSDKNMDIVAITDDALTDYVSLLQTSYNGKNVYRKVCSIRNFYKYLARTNVIESIPRINVPLNNEKVVVSQKFTMSDYDNLIVACGAGEYEKDRDRIICKLLYETSLPLEEILKLTAHDFAQYNYRYILITVKNNPLYKNISVELSEEIRYFVEQYDLQELFLGISPFKSKKILKEYGAKIGLTYDVLPTMIKNLKKTSEKLNTPKDNTHLMRDIKRVYMEIGIGDNIE